MLSLSFNIIIIYKNIYIDIYIIYHIPTHHCNGIPKIPIFNTGKYLKIRQHTNLEKELSNYFYLKSHQKTPNDCKNDI